MLLVHVLWLHDTHLLEGVGGVKFLGSCGVVAPPIPIVVVDVPPYECAIAERLGFVVVGFVLREGEIPRVLEDKLKAFIVDHRPLTTWRLIALPAGLVVVQQIHVDLPGLPEALPAGLVGAHAVVGCGVPAT
jgi:hypothetical protein